MYLGCPAISQVALNVNCRDRMIPILRGLQHLYSRPQLRQQALRLIEADVLGDADATASETEPLSPERRLALSVAEALIRQSLSAELASNGKIAAYTSGLLGKSPHPNRRVRLFTGDHRSGC